MHGILPIINVKIKTPIFSQDHFRMALHNFRKIDVNKQDGKRKIIDTFINAIYVSDEDFKIVYNVNGKEENIKLEELESSTLFSNGAPTERAPFKGALFRYIGNLHPLQLHTENNAFNYSTDK